MAVIEDRGYFTEYIADAAVLEYGFGFGALNAEHIVCYYVEADGTKTTISRQEFEVAPSVSGIADGGTVTFVDGFLTSGRTLRIERVTPILQEQPFANQVRINPPNVAEGLDRLTYICQELAGAFGSTELQKLREQIEAVQAELESFRSQTNQNFASLQSNIAALDVSVQEHTAQIASLGGDITRLDQLAAAARSVADLAYAATGTNAESIGDLDQRVTLSEEDITFLEQRVKDLEDSQTETGGLPPGGTADAFLARDSANETTWKTPVQAADSLPPAAASQAGVVKVGEGLQMVNGVLSATGSGAVSDIVDYATNSAADLDLNTVTSTARYLCTGTSLVNAPPEFSGPAMVDADLDETGTYCRQKYTAIPSGYTFIRVGVYTAGAWLFEDDWVGPGEGGGSEGGSGVGSVLDAQVVRSLAADLNNVRNSCFLWTPVRGYANEPPYSSATTSYGLQTIVTTDGLRADQQAKSDQTQERFYRNGNLSAIVPVPGINEFRMEIVNGSANAYDYLLCRLTDANVITARSQLQGAFKVDAAGVGTSLSVVVPFSAAGFDFDTGGFTFTLAQNTASPADKIEVNYDNAGNESIVSSVATIGTQCHLRFLSGEKLGTAEARFNLLLVWTDITTTGTVWSGWTREPLDLSNSQHGDLQGRDAANSHPQSAVTNLVPDLAAKAPLDSPAFTGTVTAPTPETAANGVQVATAEFVRAQSYAPLASPVFSGTPSAPTAPAGTNTAQIATTAFVQNAVTSSADALIKAKVCFTTDTSGNPTIRRAYNVASVTVQRAGIWRVTFSSPMPDIYYCVSGMAGPGNGRFLTFIDSSGSVNPSGTVAMEKTVSYFHVAYHNSIVSSSPQQVTLIVA